MTSKTLRTLRENPLILPLYTPSLLHAIARGSLIPILPLFASNLTESYQIIGFMLASDAFGRLMGDIPASFLIRQWGKKRTMLFGLTVLASSTAALFFATAVWHVIILRFVAGAAEAFNNIARHAYLTNSVILGQRGRAIALFGGITRIGSFIGPAIGGAVAAAYALRLPFLMYAALISASIFFVAVFLKRDGKLPSTTKGKHAPIFKVLAEHYRIFASAGMAQLFAQMIRQGRQVVIPLFAADVLGLDVQSIGFIVSASSAVDMSMFYVAGWLMDNYGRKWAVVPSFTLQGIAMALIPFTGSFTTILLAVCLLGFANGLSSGTMMTIGADLAPAEEQGEFLAVWRLIGDGGFMGAPLIVGGIADVLTLSAAAVAMAISGWLAAGTFGFLVPETLKKPQPLEAN